MFKILRYLDAGMGVGLAGIGANLITQQYNNQQQNATNMANQHFAVAMYDKQRQDALADWNMQNAYNSPSAQMARFKAAGLNPNLIYGSANNSPAVNVRASNAAQPTMVAPHVDTNSIGAALMSMFEIMNKQANTDNLKAQTDLVHAQAAGALQGNQFAADLHPAALDAAQLNLDKTNAEINKLFADTDFTIDSNQRANLLQAPNTQKLLEEIQSIRLNNAKTQAERDKILAETNLLKNQQIISDLDVYDRQNYGIHAHDSAPARIVQTLGAIEKSGLENFLNYVKTAIESVGSPTKVSNWGQTLYQNFKR